MRTLVRPGLRRAGAASLAASALRRRLTRLPEKERLGALVALVQEVVAAVLGLAGAAAVPANQPLKELGLDSLMAVEVRNQLSARAETTLPTTLVFDYPTPEAIAKLLLRQAFAELDGAGQALSAPRVRATSRSRLWPCRVAPPGMWSTRRATGRCWRKGGMPSDRFPSAGIPTALYDPEPEARGKSYAREGGFMRDVDQFDRAFSGIAPREAVSWIRSSGWCWRWRGRRWSRQGFVRALNEMEHGVYSGSMGTRLRPGQRVAGGAGWLRRDRVRRAACFPGACRTRWVCKARR